MIRCWNCGLPDVADRCPRCGAPQEQARRGAPPPPPAGPPGGFQPPPGFIVNGTRGDMRPAGNPSGPLAPPGQQSGFLRPQGHPSGPLPPRGPSGPLYPPRNPSGPLSPGESYPPRGPLPPGESYPPRASQPGGRSHANTAPPGWDIAEMPPGPRRNPSMPLPSRSGPIPPFEYPEEEPYYPAEDPRGALPPRPEARQPSRPISSPRGWDEGRASGPLDLAGGGWAEEQDYRDKGEPRVERRQGESPRPKFERRLEPNWDEEERWGWSEPEDLTLSAVTNAVLGAAIGGVLGGAVWVGAEVLTEFSLPYLTVVVGLLAGFGARFALVQTRPWILGAFGAVGAALAFLLTQYALFDYALFNRGYGGLFALSPLSFPQVYLNYVTGGADPVLKELGFSGTHPLDMGLLLACMAACWLVLLSRKK
jgi:hypothetical protein